jgi:hypothetical protein
MNNLKPAHMKLNGTALISLAACIYKLITDGYAETRKMALMK